MIERLKVFLEDIDNCGSDSEKDELFTDLVEEAGSLGAYSCAYEVVMYYEAWENGQSKKVEEDD